MKNTHKPTPAAGYTVALTIGGLPLVAETTGEPLRDPAAVRAILDDVANLAQEAFLVLTVNKKYRLIARHIVTLGIADASLCHPREVFRPAIADGACAVFVAHNHPSGDPTPSAEDIKATRQMVSTGKIIGIDVLDSIVIGRGATPYTSLRECGLVDFS